MAASDSVQRPIGSETESALSVRTNWTLVSVGFSAVLMIIPELIESEFKSLINVKEFESRIIFADFWLIILKMSSLTQN